jgi:hypothetical protein
MLRSVSPEVLEPIRRQFGVADGVHDVLVPEIMLEGPCIPSVISQLVTAGIPKHGRMHRELNLALTARDSAG